MSGQNISQQFFAPHNCQPFSIQPPLITPRMQVNEEASATEFTKMCILVPEKQGESGNVAFYPG